MMEVYAATLSHADNQIGRLLDAVLESGQLENTLVIFLMGDNGASAEGTLQGTTNEVATAANGVTESLPYLLSMIDELGGPLTYNHYPVAWAHAMDTPMQWTKQVASHFGGTRNGMVVSWPRRIKDSGGRRSQFCHVIDIVPTIYEATGIVPPTVMDGVPQKPIEGVSLVYTFDNANAPTRHGTQYFELVGNRAIYKDGWMASTTPLRLPWVTSGYEPSPDDFKWELYNISEDFSQANDLAEKHPDKLKELHRTAFEVEAKKYNVYPLDASFASRADPAIRPSLTRGRSEFVYYNGMIRIPEGSAPNFKNRSWAIAAEVTIPDNGASGVLATIGGRFGGWALLMQDSKPQFVYALSNQPEHKFRIVSDQSIPPGNHVVRFGFKYDGGFGKGATGALFVDGQQVAEGLIPQTVPIRFSLDETFDIGEDTGTPVVEDYVDKMPYSFTGKLKKFVVILEPEKLTEEERQQLLAEEARAGLAVH